MKTFLLKTTLIGIITILFTGCTQSIKFENYSKVDKAKSFVVDRKKPILNPNQVTVRSNVYDISDSWLKGLVEINSKFKEYFNTYNTGDMKLDITLLNYGYDKQFVRGHYEDCSKYEDRYEKRKCHKENNRNSYYEIIFYSKMKAVYTYNGEEKVFYEENEQVLLDKHSNPYDDYHNNYNTTTMIQGTYDKIFLKIRESLRKPFDIIEIRKHKQESNYAIKINAGTCNYMYKGQTVRIYSNKGVLLGTGEITKESGCSFAWIKTEELERKPNLTDKAYVLFED